MSREIPILFQGAMVREIIAGLKTVTRRLVRWHGDRTGDAPWDGAPAWIWRALHFDDYAWVAMWNHDGFRSASSPCVQPPAAGDLLWVRETWRTLDSLDAVKPSRLHDDAPIWFDADDFRERGDLVCVPDGTVPIGRGRPGIFLQRRFARLFLRVVSVRPERLHDITDEDALREGCVGHPVDGRAGFPVGHAPRDEFADLWRSINGAESWDADPWVWRIEFARASGGAA